MNLNYYIICSHAVHSFYLDDYIYCFSFYSNSYIVIAKRSAVELFEYYYTVLGYSLPIKDTDILDKLYKHDLLPGDLKIKLETLTEHYERSSYFLDNVIKPGLAVGDRNCFVSLLAIMRNCKDSNVKDLANRVDEELLFI